MKSPPQSFKIEKALGAYLYPNDGSPILDGISSWWVTTHGHCEPRIAEAIARQSQKLDQVLFANFEHENAEQLISILGSFLPSELSHFFFSDNGSTSVEVALKMAIQFWQQCGLENKNKILSFKHSYHGDTVGAMSLSAEGVFTKPYRGLLFPVKRADQGVYLRDGIEAFTTSAMEILNEQHKELAAIILEPLIQGAGGMIVWPKVAVQKIVQEAQKNNVLVIFDEVMTGFGRTGSLFPHKRLGLTPDIVCLSKGLTGGSLPLGLTVTKPKVFEAFLSLKKEKMLFHGHSFTGNAISCAAATASLQLFKDRNYDQIWSFIERVHRAKAKSIENHPLVKDIRILGTMAAIEIADSLNNGYTSSITNDFCSFSLERGVFLRPLGNVIYTLPPYCVSEADLDLIWQVMVDFLSYLERLRLGPS